MSLCRKLLVLFGLLLAVPWQRLLNLVRPEDTGFVNSLHSVRRVRADEISVDEFWYSYILPGVPVIVELAHHRDLPPSDHGGTGEETLWDMDRFLEECGQNNVSILSRATQDTLHNIQRSGAALNLLLYSLMRLLLGVTPDGYMAQRRSLNLGDLGAWMARAEASHAAWGPPASPWLLALAARFLPTAAALNAMMRVAIGTPYLADMPAFQLCPSLEGASGGPISAALARSAEFTSARWLAEALGLDAQLLDPRDGPNFFWGGSGSFLYPLHVDIVDADTMTQVLHGCKEFVILPSRHAPEAVRSTSIPSTTAYSFDPFDAPALDSQQHIGYHGVATAGDLFFIPGDSLHHVRNNCPNTVAISIRNWRTTYRLRAARALEQ